MPERIDAEVGQVVKLTVHNQGNEYKGNIQHDLVVCDDDVAKDANGNPEAPATCGKRLAFTGMIANNATTTLTFTADKPGDHAVYCDIPGHAQGGMMTLLHVTGPGGTETKKTVPLPSTTLAALALALALALVRRRPS